MEEKTTTKRKISKKELLIPIGIMLGLVGISFAVMMFLTQAERVTITETVYQYVFTTRDTYSGGISMKASEDGIIIDNGFQEYETDGYPFYYADRQELILSDDFLWMDTEGEILGRVDHFTQLKPSGDGFLHDGKDVYIFMESAKIIFNKKAVTVPVFSYVVCGQGQSILICPYGSKAIYEELSQEGATAELEGGVVINLADDTYTRLNGVLNLLFTSPEIFDPVGGDE